MLRTWNKDVFCSHAHQPKSFISNSQKMNIVLFLVLAILFIDDLYQDYRNMILQRLHQVQAQTQVLLPWDHYHLTTNCRAGVPSMPRLWLGIQQNECHFHPPSSQSFSFLFVNSYALQPTILSSSSSRPLFPQRSKNRNKKESRMFFSSLSSPPTIIRRDRKSRHKYHRQYHPSEALLSLSSKKQNEEDIVHYAQPLANNSDSKVNGANLPTESNDLLHEPGDQVQLMEVDVRHNTRTLLTYDPAIERFVDYHPHDDEKTQRKKNRKNNPTKFKKKISKLFTNAFLPEGVTDSYYKFVQWRVIQRFINANVHVFGTQSLLMGLGKQNKRISSGASALGLSAVFNWVLKDALGKIVRMLWASRMGRKFDPDAKRWRYRSSLLFALGNGLEVMTYVYPHLFLLLATMANACKQMGMLTSSATRNALYNSFRDGTKENIGDITAKGEAQIAIVDLFGIVSGVCLSRTIGTSVRSVLSIWILLQVVEVFCVYKEIRAVVFRMLNFERLWIVVNKFLEIFNERDLRNGSAKDIPLPTPDMLANEEKIFIPPNHLARRAISFGSLSRAKLSPEELSDLIDVFQNEKYILVVGQDLKNKRIKWNWFGHRRDEQGEEGHTNTLIEQLKLEAQENCHIVLHADANNADIVKSTLALAILRRKLGNRLPATNNNSSIIGTRDDGQIEVNGVSNLTYEEELIELVRTQRTKDCIQLIREAKRETDQLFAPFLKVLSARGWATPARFMFGRVSMRTEWPIKR